MADRRSFLQSAFGITAGLFASEKLVAQTPQGQAERLKKRRTQSSKASFNVPVITPDVGDLPFAMDGDVKVFHLIAQVIKQAITPDKKIDVWGFIGSAPGPTLQVTQGDRVRVIFDNQLPESTSIHWHGFEDQRIARRTLSCLAKLLGSLLLVSANVQPAAVVNVLRETRDKI